MDGVVKPRALLLGDTIAVVTPSEPITKQDQEQLERFFSRFDYKIKFAPNVGKRIGDYAAGSPQERAADINAAFADPEVKAVVVAVGGYVASQILPLIDFDIVKKNPKIFTGYSDATTLQLAFLAKTGLVSFHSPNATYLPGRKITGYTVGNFWRTLTTQTTGTVIKPQSVWQEMRPGSAEGILFGGNLSCICHLLGTAYDPIAGLDKIFGKDAKFIFFWEEGYEQFSDIMRNFWQLRNTGFLERVSGMVIGKLTAVREIDYQDFPTKKELILSATEQYNFPIIYGVDFGHEVPQATIPIGVSARMDTKTNLLEVLEPAVV